MIKQTEKEFEIHQQAGLLNREIQRLIVDLQKLSDFVGSGNDLYEHYFPQQVLIDLAIQYGQLIAMKREMKRG
jgi:hypothetical protein